MANSNKSGSPELLTIIQTMLYLIHFWSGLMLLDKGLGDLTRLNNNIVENWFGYLKNDLLKMLAMASQLAGILYERLLVKYFEFYMDHTTKEPQKQLTLDRIEEI